MGLEPSILFDREGSTGFLVDQVPKFLFFQNHDHDLLRVHDSALLAGRFNDLYKLQIRRIVMGSWGAWSSSDSCHDTILGGWAPSGW